MTAEENRYVSYTQDLYQAAMLLQQKVDMILLSMADIDNLIEELKDCNYKKESFKDLIEKCQEIVSH
jgi:hypothetical protein